MGAEIVSPARSPVPLGEGVRETAETISAAPVSFTEGRRAAWRDRMVRKDRAGPTATIDLAQPAPHPPVHRTRPQLSAVPPLLPVPRPPEQGRRRHREPR